MRDREGERDRRKEKNTLRRKKKEWKTAWKARQNESTEEKNNS